MRHETTLEKCRRKRVSVFAPSPSPFAVATPGGKADTGVAGGKFCLHKRREARAEDEIFREHAPPRPPDDGERVEVQGATPRHCCSNRRKKESFLKIFFGTKFACLFYHYVLRPPPRNRTRDARRCKEWQGRHGTFHESAPRKT